MTQSELAIVRDILRARLPVGTQAWVFGSRANTTARRYSDLDLAIESEKPLDISALGDVAEAFSESDLPYKVDVIDLNSINAAFRAIIERDLIALSF